MQAGIHLLEASGQDGIATKTKTKAKQAKNKQNKTNKQKTTSFLLCCPALAESLWAGLLTLWPSQNQLLSHKPILSRAACHCHIQQQKESRRLFWICIQHPESPSRKVWLPRSGKSHLDLSKPPSPGSGVPACPSWYHSTDTLGSSRNEVGTAIKHLL